MAGIPPSQAPKEGGRGQKCENVKNVSSEERWRLMVLENRLSLGERASAPKWGTDDDRISESRRMFYERGEMHSPRGSDSGEGQGSPPAPP